VPRLTGDLQRDPFYRWLDRWFLLLQWPIGACLYAYGQLADVHGGGLGLVLWAIPLRLVVVYHVTWLVNSATHAWGYRNFDSPDLSRNCWRVGITTTTPIPPAPGTGCAGSSWISPGSTCACYGPWAGCDGCARPATRPKAELQPLLQGTFTSNTFPLGAFKWRPFLLLGRIYILNIASMNAASMNAESINVASLNIADLNVANLNIAGLNSA
jgi:hypothetical protein